MDTALGLLGLVAYIAGAIALSAVLTWAVIKFLPTPGGSKDKPA